MSQVDTFCPICESQKVEEITAPLCVIVFEGKEYPVTRLGMLCCECNFGWRTGLQAKLNGEGYWRVANSIEGYFDRSHVLTIREMYELTDGEAGDVFGISAAQYARYEEGVDEVPRELGVIMQRALDDPDFVVDRLIAAKKSRL